MALRIGIERPPTWVRGSGHSHRSSGSRPRATADPSALARKFVRLSGTGLGAAVVPEVWSTATGESSRMAVLAEPVVGVPAVLAEPLDRATPARAEPVAGVPA